MNDFLVLLVFMTSMTIASFGCVQFFMGGILHCTSHAFGKKFNPQIIFVARMQ
jgi:hypothetical protein